MSFLSYWTVSNKHAHVFSFHPSPSHCSPWPRRHSRVFFNNFSHVTHSHPDWAASCPVICTIQRGGGGNNSPTRHSREPLFALQWRALTSNTSQFGERMTHRKTRQHSGTSEPVKICPVHPTIASKKEAAFLRQRVSKFSGQTNKYTCRLYIRGGGHLFIIRFWHW